LRSDGPEHDDDGLSSLFDDPSEPPTSGVRITGATQAGSPEATSLFEVPSAEPEVLAEVELPPWTEPPTGQLPAVLAHDDESENPWASVPAPTWREDSADWASQDETFEHAMLADDRPMADDFADVLARQPWEFETPSAPGTPSSFGAADYEAISTAEDDEVAIAPMAEELHVSSDGVLVDPDFAELAIDTAPLAAAAEATRPRTQRSSRGRRGPSAGAGMGATPPEPPRRRPAAERSNSGNSTVGRDRPLGVAIATGIGLVILLLVVFHLGNMLTALLVGLVAIVGVLEGFSMFRAGGYKPATFLGFVVTALLMFGAYNYGDQAVGAMVVLMVAGTLAWYALRVEHTDPIAGIGTTLLAFCWIAVCAAYAELLLSPSRFPNNHGVAFLAGVILTTVGYDVAALFVGQRWGKRPMAPRISPKKTWEGLIGGTVAAMLIALVLVRMIHPWTFTAALWLGILTAIVSPLGDLAESFIKRTVGLKDSGRMLPGHGGMLDRVDGLLFMLPVTYLLVRSLNLG